MKQDWTWMPHPGHFICSKYCRFFVNTYVNGYIVSTVGEYVPPETVREVLADSRGIVLQGRGDAREADYMTKIGFEEIGADRKYETMVFPAKPSKHKCCPFVVASHEEIDALGYNEAEEAYLGHLAMCEKYDLEVLSAGKAP